MPLLSFNNYKKQQNQQVKRQKLRNGWLCVILSLSHTYRMTLSGQCRLSVGFKALQVVCGRGAVWQLLGRGESQSSDVSSAMSSDCVSDISRSLRMLSG